MSSKQPAPDDAVAAWSALLRLHAHLVPALDHQVRSATGLPLAWYDVLLELNAAPDRQMRMLDLGEAVVLSRSRVSRVVDELVSAGYVTRIANPDDRRSAFAHLTPAGRAALKSAAPVYLDGIRGRFGALTASEAATLRSLLEKVLNAER